jgi:hypothetical protein
MKDYKWPEILTTEKEPRAQQSSSANPIRWPIIPTHQVHRYHCFVRLPHGGGTFSIGFILHKSVAPKVTGLCDTWSELKVSHRAILIIRI